MTDVRIAQGVKLCSPSRLTMEEIIRLSRWRFLCRWRVRIHQTRFSFVVLQLTITSDGGPWEKHTQIFEIMRKVGETIDLGVAQTRTDATTLIFCMQKANPLRFNIRIRIRRSYILDLKSRHWYLLLLPCFLSPLHLILISTQQPPNKPKQLLGFSSSNS